MPHPGYKPLSVCFLAFLEYFLILPGSTSRARPLIKRDSLAEFPPANTLRPVDGRFVAVFLRFYGQLFFGAKYGRYRFGSSQKSQIFLQPSRRGGGAGSRSIRRCGELYMEGGP